MPLMINEVFLYASSGIKSDAYYFVGCYPYLSNIPPKIVKALSTDGKIDWESVCVTWSRCVWLLIISWDVPGNWLQVTLHKM